MTCSFLNPSGAADVKTTTNKDTVTRAKENLLHCSIAIVSIAFVITGSPQMAGFAGMIYMLTGVVMTFMVGARGGSERGNDDHGDTGA